jgi:hypothetical protein
MLSAFLKIAERIQSRQGSGDPPLSTLMASISRPFSRTVQPLHSQNEEDIALWNGLGSAMQAFGLAVHMKIELQLQVALGASIWESRKLTKGQIVLVHARNRLIALLDSRSMLAHVRPDAYPGDVDELATSAVLPQRAHIPDTFQGVPMWDLVWQYGYHHPLAWRQLPIEISYALLKLRRLPLTSASILPSSATRVMELLAQEDKCFAQLLSECQFDPEEVFRCVVALYLTRSLQRSEDSSA